MPKETQSSLANDVRVVEQAGTMQDFIVRYEVVPSDVQDASLAPYIIVSSRRRFAQVSELQVSRVCAAGITQLRTLQQIYL